MKLVLCVLVPHPPVLLPEVGDKQSGRVAVTHASMEVVAQAIEQIAPRTVVILSPHGPVFSDAVGILHGEVVSGDLREFGAPCVSQTYDVDRALAEAIVSECQDVGLPVALVHESVAQRTRARFALDHGMLVPLQYLWKRGLRPSLVPVGMGFLPFGDLYGIGVAIGRAVESLEPREASVVLMASGDLSHRLTPDAPAGHDARAAEFDSWLLGRLDPLDPERLVEVDRALLERAGECGFRTIVMMAGALDGLEVKSEVLSYEGPFGVGYAVATFSPGEPSGYSVRDTLAANQLGALLKVREAETPPAQLARDTVEMWVRHGTRHPTVVLPGLPTTAAVFVSIKKHGELRGCIGTTSPSQPTLAEEIIANATSAAIADPRFEPVEASELDSLTYSVDILSRPEQAADESSLDPSRYGVIVTSGSRRGLLLPMLEGVDSVQEQLSIARKKAGIRPGEPVRLQRFEVVRYK